MQTQTAAALNGPVPPSPSALQRKAVLVQFNRHSWTARRQDTKLSREVTDRHNADPAMAQVTKRLLAKSALAEIQTAMSAAYTEHCARTLAWGENGLRILSAAGYLDYQTAMQQKVSQIETAVARFVPLYPSLMQEAQAKLNGLFDPTQYPAPEKIGAYFSASYRFYPVPDAPDFRVALGDAEVARIQAQLQRETNDLLAQTTGEVVTRIKDAVGRMAERLRAFDARIELQAGGQDVGKVGIFRDSLVENVKDLIGLLPGLNVAGDARIDQIGQELAALVVYAPDALRDSETARQEVQAKADAILSEMAELFA